MKISVQDICVKNYSIYLLALTTRIKTIESHMVASLMSIYLTDGYRQFMWFKNSKIGIIFTVQKKLKIIFPNYIRYKRKLLQRSIIFYISDITFYKVWYESLSRLLIYTGILVFIAKISKLLIDILTLLRNKYWGRKSYGIKKFNTI